MRDLMVEINKATAFRSSWSSPWTEDILFRIVSDLVEKKECSISWDYDCGEKVCGVFIENELAAYIHARFPICFATDEFSKVECVFASLLHIVRITDFYEENWYVDLEKMEWYAPEITWRCSEDAVNPNAFSIDDFRFATHS